MHVVILGGSGQAGTKLVRELQSRGHATVAVSRSAGVDLTSGVGVGQALWGAEAVVDATNPGDGYDALAFFDQAGRNVVKAETGLPIKHHIVLSIVGCDGIDSPYMRGKVTQESL